MSNFSECFFPRLSCAIILPSIFFAALDKELVCRVPDGLHSANPLTLGLPTNSGSGPRLSSVAGYGSASPSSPPPSLSSHLFISVLLPGGNRKGTEVVLRRAMPGGYLVGSSLREQFSITRFFTAGVDEFQNKKR